MSGSWFESGYDGAEREQEKRDLGGQPKRWWMRAGDVKDAVLIDDQPFAFEEHQWKSGDSKFPSFATCIAKVSQEGCPACGGRGVQKADYIGHLTMVDVTGYKTREGKEVKFELVEFCPKLKVMNKLKLKKQNKGSLINQIVRITRTDEDAPNTGDDFEWLREVDVANMFKTVTYRGKNLSEMIATANGKGDNAHKMRKFLAQHFQIPAEGDIPEQIPVFNYAKIHAPMTPVDLRRVIAGAKGYDNKGGGSSSDGGQSGTEDNIPF